MMYGTAEIRRKYKRLPSLLAVAVFFVISACGGGGAGGTDSSPSSGSSTKVAITGTISHLAQAKPSVDASAARGVILGIAWASATVQVVDASGVVAGTGMVNADGTYSVSVEPGSNYIIRVQSGNLVLKAFVPAVSAAMSVDVTPTTTAKVMVLSQVLGVANVGEPGVNAASALSSVNMSAVVVQIDAHPGIATLATDLATNITDNYDAASSTASVGATDTTVSPGVTEIAATVFTTAVPPHPFGTFGCRCEGWGPAGDHHMVRR